MYVCVCVCERERERERGRVSVCKLYIQMEGHRKVYEITGGCASAWLRWADEYCSSNAGREGGQGGSSM